MISNYPLHEAIRLGDIKVALVLIHSGIDLNEKDRLSLAPLHYAVVGRHIAIVQELLFRGVQVDIRGLYEMTPLHHAVGHVNIMALLVENGADIQAQDVFGITALHNAVTKDVESVSFLLQHGAYIDSSTKLGYTPLNLALYVSSPSEELNEIVLLLVNADADVNKACADGMTPLHNAIKNNRDISLVTLLIKHGAVLNIKNNDGFTPFELAKYFKRKEHTYVLERESSMCSLQKRFSKSYPLHDAILTGDIKGALELINSGIDLNENENYYHGLAPMHYAASRGHIKIVQALLEHGALIDVRGSCDNEGITPLMLAVIDNQIAMVSALLAFGADVNASAWDGYTALHLSLYKDNLDLARMLLEANAQVNVKNVSGNFPLHNAIEHTPVERVDLIALLLQAGADQRLIGMFGENALHIAIRRGHYETVKLLLKYYPEVNRATSDQFGYTPLILAVMNNQKEILQLLIQAGADPDKKDTEGKTALDYAFEQRKEEITQLLLVRLYKDEFGMTALHHAVLEGAESHEIEKYLTNGVYINAPRNDGVTALMLAALKGNIRLVELLVQHGANVYQNPRDSHWTALHYAISGDHPEVVSFLCAHGIDVQKTHDVLHLAANTGNAEIARLLLDAGADVYARDGCCGNTALHDAVMKGHQEVVEVLLQYGADIDEQTEEWKQSTALILAASDNNKEMVQFLLFAGADVNVQDEEGKTALDYALEFGYEEIAQMLNAQIKSENNFFD